MPRYEYVGSQDFYLGGGPEHFGEGEVVEFDDGPPENHEDKFRELPEESSDSDGSDGDSSGSSEGEGEGPSEAEEPEEEPEEEPQSESEAEPPFDPSEYTVEQLEVELDAGDFSQEELAKLYSAEVDGKNRETALEAIDEYLE